MRNKSVSGPHLRPRFGKIPTAIAYSGFGRTRLYELAGKYAGLFRKADASTLVDFDILDDILDSLPKAEIKAPTPRKQAQDSLIPSESEEGR
jgi:hypothetical protein